MPDVSSGSRVSLQWVLRRSNGYFVTSSFGQVASGPDAGILKLSGTSVNDPFLFTVGSRSSAARARRGQLGMKKGGVRRIVVPTRLSYTRACSKSSPGPVPRRRRAAADRARAREDGPGELLRPRGRWQNPRKRNAGVRQRRACAGCSPESTPGAGGAVMTGCQLRRGTSSRHGHHGHLRPGRSDGEPENRRREPFVGDPFWGGTMTNCVPGGTMTAPGGGPRPPYTDGCTATSIGTPFGPSAICWPGGSRMGGAMGKGLGRRRRLLARGGLLPRSRALRRLLRLPRRVAGRSQHGARRVARR